MKTPPKYVVVLAHADGWGALSANKMVRALREKYPDVGVHLVVSTASKNKDGEIITKVDDLKTPRQLKETNLLEYFRRIDERYAGMMPHDEIQKIYASGNLPDTVPADQQIEYAFKLGQDAGRQSLASLLTFKQLAARYCDDHEVHYTTRGGPKGGEEVAEILGRLEQQHGAKPEVLLSVDTMAIMPERVLNETPCFSCHPGPLDTVKIEGMQGTLRALTDEVLFDREGKRLEHGNLHIEDAYLKGTLFMQHPDLDKGPPIAGVQTIVIPGYRIRQMMPDFHLCAYEARDRVYDALTDAMVDHLPQLLDAYKRKALVAKANAEKAEVDKHPHERIPEIDTDRLDHWQGDAIGIRDASQPWGVKVIQNELINPEYFEGQMQRFFPGHAQDFEKEFGEVFGAAVEKLGDQKRSHMVDPLTRVMAGEPGIKITRYDPKTLEPIQVLENPPRRG